MSQITDVVFDVGRVLIDFSYKGFFALLRERGAQLKDVADFTEQAELIAYEHGEIDTEQFFAGINRLLQRPLSPQELATAWKDLFTPITAMLQLASDLKPHCGVYLLSNTSELHWQHLLSRYELDQFCHDRLASYEVGVMKPHPQIFAAAAARFDLQPSRSVFVDDLQANVAGAMACGWQGIWHREPAETRAKLSGMIGVELV